MTRTACVSVDLDGIRCYTAIHGMPAPSAKHDPVFEIGLVRLLEFLQSVGVRATLFCVGQDLDQPRNRELLADAAASGHELANHSLSHLYDLRTRDQATIEHEIAACEERIEGICGQRPTGFRTPGYNLAGNIATILHSRAYLYDSSLLPSPPYWLAKGGVMASLALTGRPSRSQMTLAGTALAPLAAYKATPQRPWQRQAGDGPWIWEVPMAVLPLLRYPLIGTSLHTLGSQLVARLTPLLSRAYPNLLNLEFHGIDFLDHTDRWVPPGLPGRQLDLRIPLERKLETYGAVIRSLRQRYDFTTLHDAVFELSKAQ